MSRRDYKNHRDYRREKRRNNNELPEEVKFYKHLTSFVIVNGIFMMVTRGKWLPIVFFWGIGLLFHYVKAFGIGRDGFLSKEWEDERKEAYRSRRRRRPAPEEEDYEELELPPLKKQKKPSWDERDLV